MERKESGVKLKASVDGRLNVLGRMTVRMMMELPKIGRRRMLRLRMLVQVLMRMWSWRWARWRMTLCLKA
jgi:hypothetical protein